MGNNRSRLEQIAAELPEATETGAEPAGYGLGRHGWIAVDVADADGRRWEQLREWIRTSYMLVAPKRLAEQVLDEEPLPTQGDQ